MESIRWPPKVRQAKIIALYQSDALGALDEALLTSVGYALLARCEAILLIRAGKMICPRCGEVFQVRGQAGNGPIPCPTPNCGWRVSIADYQGSFRHCELWVGGAGPAFEAYLAAFPRARTPQERMLAIDRLLHAFHWDLQAHLPNRPAANNLVEGSVEQVIAMLERLTFGDDAAAKAQWRETVTVMMKRRRGV